MIDFGDSPQVVDAAAGIADAALEMVRGYERRKPGTDKPRSEALPAHLPRYAVRLPVPADLKDCPTHGEREVIGFDWRETLEIVPPKLIVRRTGIPKLACKKAPECGVVEADRPVGLIEGNKYDTSIAAEIIVDKYGYHIPIYRQQDLFACRILGDRLYPYLLQISLTPRRKASGRRQAAAESPKTQPRDRPLRFFLLN
ncbi:MAG: hypothetical protein RLZZ326_1995 [Planctomycetota bacterium]